jgi:DNA-binding response OmpR family regulator
MTVTPFDLILIVEDDEALRDMLAKFLIFEGFNVRAAEHGIEALRWMEQTPPAAVVLDLVLPWMGGLGVLSAMREHRHNVKVPVIVTTGTSISEEELRQYGPVRLLRKPFAPEVLLALLREVLAEAAASARPPETQE